MRTTVTLDDDVAAPIESERARTGESFRDAVNRLLRRRARPSPPPAPRAAVGEARRRGPWSEDVPDAELAALAIEHGLVLASHDSGVRRFARLRFVDPLV